MGRGKPGVLQVRLGLVMTVAAAAIVLTVGPASAVDFYRWVDERGLVHYSNAPSDVPPGKGASRIPIKRAPISSGRAGSEAGAAGDEETEEDIEAGADGQGTVLTGSVVGRGREGRRTSARVSLARVGLRRELDETARQVAEIDRRLDTLAGLRMQHARRPHPSVGGVRAVGAADARSPEEEALAERRKGLTKRIEEIRARLAALPGR